MEFKKNVVNSTTPSNNHSVHNRHTQQMYCQETPRSGQYLWSLTSLKSDCLRIKHTPEVDNLSRSLLSRLWRPNYWTPVNELSPNSSLTQRTASHLIALGGSTAVEDCIPICESSSNSISGKSFLPCISAGNQGVHCCNRWKRSGSQDSSANSLESLETSHERKWKV